MSNSCWLFYKNYTSNEGFWKNLVWKIFNFEKLPKSRMRGFSISKNWNQKLFHFINIWVFFSIAICCPLSKIIFIEIYSMVEGNSYISKFMILSLN
jgi:hypothetical protein